ncbi:hypothetical protein Hanom_Chr01g00030361 [Helianthus anomalus]
MRLSSESDSATPSTENNSFSLSHLCTCVFGIICILSSSMCRLLPMNSSQVTSFFHNQMSDFRFIFTFSSSLTHYPHIVVVSDCVNEDPLPHIHETWAT